MFVFTKSTMTFAEFEQLLQQHTDYDPIYDTLYLKSTMELTCDDSNPDFYYFKDLGGKAYVVRHDSDEQKNSVVYEVSGITANPCELVLRATLNDWSQDKLETLASYYLVPHEDELPGMCGDEENVKIWVQHHYNHTKDYRPTDHYLIDPKTKLPRVFDTAEEAWQWIEDNEPMVYHLSYGETNRPSMLLVA